MAFGQQMASELDDECPEAGSVLHRESQESGHMLKSTQHAESLRIVCFHVWLFLIHHFSFTAEPATNDPISSMLSGIPIPYND